MEDKDRPINTSFFDAAFKANLADNKQFKPVTDARAKEILDECIDWHEKVYLPAELKEEERLGRKLDIAEQIFLYFNLKW